MGACRGKGPAASALSLVLLLAACGDSGAEPGLAEVKAAAERYRDVSVAIAEGYTTDNKCVTAQMLGFPAEQGAMGLHYVRRDLLGLPDKPVGRVAGSGTYTDFGKPAMLVYEPQPDGSLELVAVENLVFKKAWEAAGNDEPPSFRGNPYLLLEDDPATSLDEAHGFEPHYELHAWVFRDNPLGTFAAFNPKVTCQHHKPPAPAAMHAAAPQGAPMHAAAHSGPGLRTTANAAVPAIAPQPARAMLRSGALLIDVREADELRESGQLAGAVHRPMSSFGQQAGSLPRDRPIILYCRSGRRAAIAGDILQSLGFTQVYNLGSFEAAAKGGWPTSSP